jgi:uncharacterized protein YjbJ (UPF0337 family)
MNKHTIKGDWKIAKGKIKEQWGKLTNDQIDQIDGQKDQLVGHVQKVYGRSRDEAQREVDDFFKD